MLLAGDRSRPARPDSNGRVQRAILLVAALAYLAIGWQQATRDAPAVDEGVDVSSGVASLVHRDLRMVPEHPALPKALAALAALPADPVVPETTSWTEGQWFDWSDDFVAANEAAGRLDSVLLGPRLVVLVEGLAVGVVLFFITRRFFGHDGATLVALLWLTTPYVVGLSHFAMLDVPFTLAATGLVLAVLRWLEAGRTGRLAVVGLILGLALATRHTALVLAVWVAAVVAVRLRGRPREAGRAVGLVAVVSLATLWGVYRGLSPTGPPPQISAQMESLVSAQSSSVTVALVGAAPLPLEWRAGFAYLDLTAADRPASLVAASWYGSRPWYFPAAALLKLPVTVLASVVAGWGWAIRGRRRRQLMAVVAAPALGLWLVLLLQPLNLGLRMALPTVALALVGAGAAAGPLRTAMTTSRRSLGPSVAVAALALALGSTQVAAMIGASPHSLAWSPWPFTPAYRWVSDSNVDVGQGLYELRDWSTTHDRPFVALGSTRGLHVGGGSRSLIGTERSEVTGWVAVGVTALRDTFRAELGWLRAYCPVGSIAGGSVLVYRFASPPSPGNVVRPAPACFGAEWSTRATDGDG